MPQNYAKSNISDGNYIGLATTLIKLKKWLISCSQIFKNVLARDVYKKISRSRMVKHRFEWLK
jgi:hypothetical protein